LANHDEQKISEYLRSLLKNRRQIWRADCLDEERLIVYMAGGMPEKEKQVIETHLAACSFCVDELVALHKLAQAEGRERVPQRLIDRALALVRDRQKEPGVLDLVITFVKDSLPLVSTSGQWIAPLTMAPAGVRGRPRSAETSIVRVEKEFGRFNVGVEVERLQAGLCQVAVSVVGPDRKPAEDIRVTLLAGGREQASYLTRLGEAIFDRIPEGEYHLAISDSGGPVGTIRIGLTA
jgi:hypothetical protein